MQFPYLGKENKRSQTVIHLQIFIIPFCGYYDYLARKRVMYKKIYKTNISETASFFARRHKESSKWNVILRVHAMRLLRKELLFRVLISREILKNVCLLFFSVQYHICRAKSNVYKTYQSGISYSRKSLFEKNIKFYAIMLKKMQKFLNVFFI